jgi:hypothetical protein
MGVFAENQAEQRSQEDSLINLEVIHIIEF